MLTLAVAGFGILLALVAWFAQHNYLTVLANQRTEKSEREKAVGDAKAAAEKAADEAKSAADAAHTIAVQALDELAKYRLHVAENYTSLKRFEGFEAALFKKLDAIEGKLDGKADKH